jgi:hypothetical protein
MESITEICLTNIEPCLANAFAVPSSQLYSLRLLVDKTAYGSYELEKKNLLRFM